MVTLEEIKQWIFVDSNDDDKRIQTIADSSECLLAELTGKWFMGSKLVDCTSEYTTYFTTEQEKMATVIYLGMIFNLYENGDISASSNAGKFKLMYQSMLNQLKYSG